VIKALLLLLPILSAVSYGQNVPRDGFNTPIYGGIGLPYLFESVTLTTTSYVSVATLPIVGTGITQRQFRNILIRNPSTTLSVYICFGSGGCGANMMKIPPNYTFVTDQMLIGWSTSVTNIYGKLDSAGSVTPEITVW